MSRILIVCMIGLPFNVHAGLIGTDEVVSIAQAQAARDMVRQFVDRTEVASQLQALGLTPEAAKDRVNALTDSEIVQLAAQMDRAPAGADGGWVLLILLAVLIWWLVTRK
ncbi:MAG: PA2779 family protein [Burkholderiales bacterium]